MNEIATQKPRQLMSGDLLSRFSSYIDAKPRTVEEYEKSIGQFMRWLADRGITAPAREDVIAYRDELKPGHKAATVQAYIIAIRQFFNWTATEGIYPNIADKVKGAKIERNFKKDPLTSEQTKNILSSFGTDTVRDARDYAAFLLMATSGLRTVEVIRANIEDIRNIGNCTVLFIQGKGKDEKSDFVKLAPQTEKAIKAYLNMRGKLADTEPLFASESNRNTGERMTTRSISRTVKTSMRGVGLDSSRLTAHSLRHTAATLNLLAGGTLEETQQLLRHQKIDTTTQYAHHLKRIANNSEARIENAIF